ncbi:band-7 C-terminal domain-containing protein, partial [uncultured Desulfovibrio sp.]
RDITPPNSVMQAMEKQMRAEREKRAAIAQSEGEKQSQINLAEGAKAAAIAESEGRKQAMINMAEGEAAQIRAVAQATAEGLDLLARQLGSDGGIAAAQLRLAEAYVEKFGALAKNGTTTIIPANVGDVAGMVATMTRILRPGEGLSGSPRQEKQ